LPPSVEVKDETRRANASSLLRLAQPPPAMLHRSLHAVADQLPFHIDDTAQVNAAFLRWHKHASDDDKRVIDLWTYCYVYRYFGVKFMVTDQHVPLCFDELVAASFDDVQRGLHRIRHPERYTAWVGTICKHRFVNYLRTRRRTVSFEEETPLLAVEPSAKNSRHDASAVLQSAQAAITALPTFLRDVARMYLLEQHSYKAISQQTGHPLPRLRAYLHRALGRLRQDTRLLALFNEWQDG